MDNVMQAIERLEKQIRDAHKENARLFAENAKLKSSPELQILQAKLDSFIEETTKKFEMQLTAFKALIKELNAEGVRRYEGATRSVNSHTDAAVDRILIKLESLQFLPNENIQNPKN
jgi:regulator of replication initiation timing